MTLTWLEGSAERREDSELREEEEEGGGWLRLHLKIWRERG